MLAYKPLFPCQLQFHKRHALSSANSLFVALGVVVLVFLGIGVQSVLGGGAGGGAGGGGGGSGTFTWTSNANGNWSTTTNWTPTGSPEDDDTLIFSEVGANVTATNNLAAELQVESLTLANTDFSYVLSGSSILLGGSGSLTEIDASAGGGRRRN